jgi:hypothetical protein
MREECDKGQDDIFDKNNFKILKRFFRNSKQEKLI